MTTTAEDFPNLDPYIQADSDQLDAVDLTHPTIFTITHVAGRAGRIEITLAEWPKPWRPAKTVLRILAIAWGKDTKQWIGQAVQLYNEPSVVYAGKQVGGIRIKAMTGIDQPTRFPVQESQKKKTSVQITPLKDAPKPAEQLSGNSGELGQLINDATTLDELRALYSQATPEQQARINQKAAAIKEGETNGNA